MYLNYAAFCLKSQSYHLSLCFGNLYYLIHIFEDVPLVEFMYLVFTRMVGESYCRRLRSLLLYLCYAFRALINSLVCRSFFLFFFLPISSLALLCNLVDLSSLSFSCSWSILLTCFSRNFSNMFRKSETE